METMDKLVSLLIHGWESPPPSLPQRLFDKRGHHDHAWHRIGPLTYAMHVGTDPWGFMNVITDFVIRQTCATLCTAQNRKQLETRNEGTTNVFEKALLLHAYAPCARHLISTQSSKKATQSFDSLDSPTRRLDEC